jgi:aryl-alcohol dehydrogenase-like predicted oxidoreductase
MKYRQLGRSGLTVSALGMGAMNLSFGTGSAVDERTELVSCMRHSIVELTF